MKLPRLLFSAFANASTSGDENMEHSSSEESVDLVMTDAEPNDQENTGGQTTSDNNITGASAASTTNEIIFSSDDVYLTLSPLSQARKLLRKMELKDIEIDRLKRALNHVKISSATRKFWLVTKGFIGRQDVRIKKLRNEILDYTALIDNSKSKLSEREHEIEELKQKLQTAEKEAKKSRETEATIRDTLDRKILRLEDDIDKLMADNKTLNQQLIATKDCAASPQSVSNSTKVADAAIVNLWNSMSYNIRDMATTLLTGCPSQEELRSELIDASSAVGRMSARHCDLLQDEDIRSLVVERYIWNGIMSSIFGHGEEDDLRGAWSGRVGDRFVHICRDLFGVIQEEGHDAKKFFRWKAKGGAMIEKIMGIKSWDTYEAVGPELEGWYKFLPHDKKNCRATRLSIDNALDKIYEEAVELQRIFMKSKAHFLVEWEPSNRSYAWPSRYHPDMMEAEMWEKDLDRTSRVVFRVSPFLTKIGTADGDNYDRYMLLAKQRVVCD